MTDKLVRYASEDIQEIILTVRRQRVILDFDLGAIYGVSTKALNQAVKRNADRFPDDFAFQLTPEEASDFSKSQFVTLNRKPMRSQIVTASKRNVRFHPYAFTEHGAIMAASVLNTPRAVKTSLLVVRTFIKLRRMLFDNKELKKEVEELKKTTDDRFRIVFETLDHLLAVEARPKRRKESGSHLKY